jgi:hypothetical protein
MNMSSYFPVSQELSYLPPDAVYVAPPYNNYNAQPPPPNPPAMPIPSIRVVDTHLAYARPHSIATTAIAQPPAFFPYDQQAPVWNQAAYSQPSPAVIPQLYAAPPLNGYNSPRELATDHQLSPIKQHIHQIREEAEEWRRKWMASQVSALSISSSCARTALFHKPTIAGVVESCLSAHTAHARNPSRSSFRQCAELRPSPPLPARWRINGITSRPAVATTRLFAGSIAMTKWIPPIEFVRLLDRQCLASIPLPPPLVRRSFRWLPLPPPCAPAPPPPSTVRPLYHLFLESRATSQCREKMQ